MDAGFCNAYLRAARRGQLARPGYASIGESRSAIKRVHVKHCMHSTPLNSHLAFGHNDWLENGVSIPLRCSHHDFGHCFETGVLAPLSSEDSLERKSLVEAVVGTFAGFYNANLRVARRGQRGPVGPACPPASTRETSLQVK